jgi:heme-degrading monooxygenase HmoA
VNQESKVRLTPAEKPTRVGPLWRTRAEKKSRNSFACQTLNARAVEFIAKAGMSAQLRDCVERSVLNFLNRQTGFAGAIVLTPHKEPRRVLVFSFWRTERECYENHWEFADRVQHAVGPLIDAFSRVQTYNATISDSLMGPSVDAAQPC